MTKEEMQVLLDRVKEKSATKQVSGILGKIVDMRARGKTKPKERGMNKTEATYSRRLEAEKLAGRIVWWMYEPVKLRLADNCGFTPDFMTMDRDGFITLVDTKAWYKSAGKVGATDDSIVKLKVVAETFPMFKVVMTWQKDHIWEEREF